MVRSVSKRAAARILFLTALSLLVQPAAIALHLAFGHAHAHAASHEHEHEHEHRHGDRAPHRHHAPDAAEDSRSDEPAHPLEDHELEQPLLASSGASAPALLALPCGGAVLSFEAGEARRAQERAPAGPRAPPPRRAAPPRAPPVAS